MTTGIEERINRLMTEHKISKTQLAKSLGISRQAVYSWFLSTSNKRSMSDENIERLARVFGVTESYLKYGVTDNGSSRSNLLTVSDCVSYEGCLELTNTVNEDVILKIKRKHQCDINKLRYIRFYDEAMYPTFQSGDRFLIDMTPLEEIKEDGYYLLVTEDKLSIRHISKDLFSSTYLLSCGNARYEDQKLNSREFFEIVNEAFRILLVQREL